MAWSGWTDDQTLSSRLHYLAYPNAEILVDDGAGNVILFLDEKTYRGKLLAGTMDPDCHAGFGTETTRPLLRAILAWVRESSGITAPALAGRLGGQRAYIQPGRAAKTWLLHNLMRCGATKANRSGFSAP